MSTYRKISAFVGGLIFGWIFCFFVIIDNNASVASVIVLVISTTLSYKIYKIQEKKRLKQEVLMCVVGNRWTLTNGSSQSSRDDFFIALNKVWVAFNDSENVISALKKLYKGAVTRDTTEEEKTTNLLNLVKEMCASVDIETKDLGDEFITTPFESSDSNN